MKIRTTYDPPPIPMWREFAWRAVDDDTYEGGCPIGWGRTEEEAIGDLLEKLAETNFLEHREWLDTVATEPDPDYRRDAKANGDWDVVQQIKQICDKEEEIDG